MGPIIALLAIAIVSSLIIRVGSLALVMTGLSADTSSFQAYSAFFGVGFTTSEAELVVNHPVRRRIIRDLIVAGNIGLPTAIATGVVSFIGSKATSSDRVQQIALLAGGFAVIWIISRLGFVRKAVDWSIRAALRRAGVVHATDYDTLLRVQSGYSITEVGLSEMSPLVGSSLGALRLRDQGVVILGIVRASGEYVGVPIGTTLIERGDVFTVYGRDRDIQAAFDTRNLLPLPAASFPSATC